jgi:hypothetical protein
VRVARLFLRVASTPYALALPDVTIPGVPCAATRFLRKAGLLHVVIDHTSG